VQRCHTANSCALFPPPGGEWHAVAISWNHRLRCVLRGIPDAEASLRLY
jgi:hypothetical protein